MTLPPRFSDARAADFAGRRRCSITGQLGRGVHGSVHLTSAMTAIKAHNTIISYARELACYNRLHTLNVSEICGHHVPQFLAHHDELWVIEMTIVTLPFLLDFAGAYLDWPPEFSDDVLAQWQHDKAEQFGIHWPQVQNILAILEHQYDIFMIDVHPGNIAFAQDGP